MKPKLFNNHHQLLSSLLSAISVHIIGSIFVLFFLLFSAPIYCIAQNSITVKQVDLPRPFNHSEIKHMMLDDDGFLWFVTNQGIWRFDGTDVQPVDIHNRLLPQNSTPDNIYRYHNLLFFTMQDIPTDTYSVLYYSIIKNQVKKLKLPGRPFNFLTDKTGALTFMTANGSKWVFTESTGLKQTENFYAYPGWIKGDGMENSVTDLNGDTYVFSHQKLGLVKKQGITWSSIVEADKQFTYVRRMYCTPKYVGVIYSNGLVVYEKNGLKRVFESRMSYALSLPANERMLPVYKNIKDLTVQCMYGEPGTGKVLVGTNNGLLEIEPDIAKPDEADRQQQVVDFFKNKSVRSIYRAPNNKLYVGTYNGFFVYDGYSFKQVCPYIAYTIQPVNKDTLLVGLEGGQGFFVLDTRTDAGHLNAYEAGIIGTTKILKFNTGYLTGAFNYLYYLTALPDGDYKIAPLLKDPKLGIVKDLKFINRELWIASTEGIFKITKAGKKIKVYPAKNALGCYAMLEDNGGIWIGTNGEGLVKIDTNGKKIKEIHFNDGLAGEYVYSILSFNKLIIAGTSGGVSVFDQSAGMQPIAVPDPPPSDGLLYQEFNHSAAFNDTSKHKIILGGTQGLTFLDADYLKSVAGKPNDQIKLSYIKSGYNTTQSTTTDIFACRRDSIVILPENNFTGLKFSGPLNEKYMLFRIKELDTKWHERKLSDEMPLFAISPGKYTLEARFPSVTDPRYWFYKSLIVVPRYYETSVFKVFLIMVVIFIVYLAWRYNANKIRQEQQMRTTIASDLHDEIGSTLTRISINSELFSMKDNTDKYAMEKISDDSKKAISSISDIIWSIDARHDNNEDLVSRMKDHAHKMLEDIAEVNYSVEGLTSANNIPQTVRQNLYLIYKEAIHNIIRHNYEPIVWIRLQNSYSGFIMEIKNTVQRKPSSGYKGQGLKNMQMRAKRIDADIQIVENPEMFSVVLKMKQLR